jgi:hypothetical protein
LAVHVGTCFCGAVAIEAEGEPIDMGYCHCNDCRAYSGAPVSTFTIWPATAVRVARGEDRLGGFNKAGISHRRFCRECGGHVFVQHPEWDLADVPAATLPTLAFQPRSHINYACAVLPIRDGLPKLKDMPAEVGGSGETLPE